MIPVQEGAIYLAGVTVFGVLTLNGKIVYDWLLNRRNGNGNGKYIASDLCIEKHKTIDNRLNKGDARFETILTEMKNINQKIPHPVKWDGTERRIV